MTTKPIICRYITLSEMSNNFWTFLRDIVTDCEEDAKEVYTNQANTVDAIVNPTREKLRKILAEGYAFSVFDGSILECLENQTIQPVIFIVDDRAKDKCVLLSLTGEEIAC